MTPNSAEKKRPTRCRYCGQDWTVVTCGMCEDYPGAAPPTPADSADRTCGAGHDMAEDDGDHRYCGMESENANPDNVQRKCCLDGCNVMVRHSSPGRGDDADPQWCSREHRAISEGTAPAPSLPVVAEAKRRVAAFLDNWEAFNKHRQKPLQGNGAVIASWPDWNDEAPLLASDLRVLLNAHTPAETGDANLDCEWCQGRWIDKPKATCSCPPRCGNATCAAPPVVEKPTT